jgi:hypothetical protein
MTVDRPYYWPCIPTHLTRDGVAVYSDRQLLQSIYDGEFKSLYKYCSDMGYLVVEDDGSWCIPSIAMTEWVNSPSFEEDVKGKRMLVLRTSDPTHQDPGVDGAIHVEVPSPALVQEGTEFPEPSVEGEIFVHSPTQKVYTCFGGKWKEMIMGSSATFNPTGE